MDPDLVLGEYVTAECNGRPVEGRVVASHATMAMVHAASGELFYCRAAKRVAGVWARVCQIVTDRTVFFATARPARLVITTGGQAVTMDVKAAVVGRKCGWAATHTGYLEVAGVPHLCKITVTIAAAGSEAWPCRSVEHINPNGVSP